MVANAHQNQDLEAMKTFDRAYLVAVVGFLVCIDGSIILDYYIRFENLRQCQSPDSLLEKPIKIGVAVGLLLVIFTIIIRTRKNLNKLQEQHLKNLPCQNAMTYLDTQIYIFLLIFQFLIRLILRSLVDLGLLSVETTFYLLNVSQMIITNLLLSFVFPIYIILKTRRYLPKLWDSDSPLILGNNDFYLNRLSQVSP